MQGLGLLGYETTGYKRPRTHYLGNWRPRELKRFREQVVQGSGYAQLGIPVTPNICSFLDYSY